MTHRSVPFPIPKLSVQPSVPTRSLTVPWFYGSVVPWFYGSVVPSTRFRELKNVYTPSTSFCKKPRLRSLDGAHTGDILRSPLHVGLVYTRSQCGPRRFPTHRRPQDVIAMGHEKSTGRGKTSSKTPISHRTNTEYTEYIVSENRSTARVQSPVHVVPHPFSSVCSSFRNSLWSQFLPIPTVLHWPFSGNFCPQRVQ